MSSVTKELRSISVRSSVKLEGIERTVQAVVTLHELYQQAGRKEWIRQGKASRVIVLSGSVLLVSLPMSDSGKYHWVLGTPQRESSNLREFYRGGEAIESWGPARKFAKNGQVEPVAYELLGGTWSVTDIGAFEAEVQGHCDWILQGDRLYFVTSRLGSDPIWLFYWDARPGEARGTGGLFRGVGINPDMVIESIL